MVMYPVDHIPNFMSISTSNVEYKEWPVCHFDVHSFPHVDFMKWSCGLVEFKGHAWAFLILTGYIRIMKMQS